MKLIIIANRLPLKANRNEKNELEFIRSVGGLTSGLESLTLDLEIHWVGWPGTFIETPQEEEFINEHLRDFNFHPVFLSHQHVQNYYDGYSNSTLWPLCHYFYSYVEFEQHYWEAYKEVNRLFAEAAGLIIEEGDVVWVQDYQLMLLPAMLRKLPLNFSIGYFHHIPFPSYELFRVLPDRAELLEGLLGADLVGFHTHDYMRHFMSACERVLDLRFTLDQVMLDSRIAFVDTFPMGINYDLYHSSSDQPAVRSNIQKLEQITGKRKTILSVDRLDYSKGILHRVKGFASFLENHPEYHEKVSLIMIVVESRDQVDSYSDLKTKIDESIGTINGNYSTLTWTPVHYFYHGFGFDELVAFYNMADIALVTPLRDGMNLVAKEYIASKKEEPGVLILSEMAGAATELSDSIIINPNNIREIEDAIVQALEMPEQEKLDRLSNMQTLIKRKSVDKWASSFVNQLLSIREKNESINIERIGTIAKEKMQEDYRNAAKRLFILDYDGTLAAFKSRPEDAQPTPAVLNLLEKMLKDPANKVVISSGRDHQTLEKWLGHLDLSFAAEHGAFYKEDGIWASSLDEGVPWDQEILDIVTQFTEKTPRSRIEIKKTTLVWHYRNADSWLSSLREQQLFEALITPCSKLGLQIMRGNKIIEIKSTSHDKGTEVIRLLARDDFDFIFAAGDDTTDEDTFRELPDYAYTVKIGNVSEYARYSLKEQRMLVPLLEFISRD